MKKVFSIVAVAAITALVACGPSADQKANEQRIADSTKAALAASQATADSLLKAQTAAATPTDSAATTATPATTETH